MRNARVCNGKWVMSMSKAAWCLLVVLVLGCNVMMIGSMGDQVRNDDIPMVSMTGDGSASVVGERLR